MVLTEVDHSFLAHVFLAFNGENIRRDSTISGKVFCLADILWEVLHHNSGVHFFGKRLNEVRCNGFIILAVKAILSKEIIEVNKLHIGSVGHQVTNGRLA